MKKQSKTASKLANEEMAKKIKTIKTEKTAINLTFKRDTS